MCRELWGANAAKELQFILGKSDRTCRAWASGDSEPPAGILAALILSDHCQLVVAYIARDADRDAVRQLMFALELIARFKIEPR